MVLKMCRRQLARVYNNIVKITKLTATRNLSSLGNETLKVFIQINDQLETSVVVPAGISAGKYEAKVVGANEAINQVRNMANELVEQDFDQESLDKKLLMSEVAGNTSIAISACFWKAVNIAGAKCSYGKFPKLLLLLFEGAKHGNTNLTIQEFMVVEDSLETAISDFKKMREYLVSSGIESTVGAEGGFSPINFTNLLILELMQSVFPEKHFALDAAGSFREKEVDWGKFILDYKLSYLEDPYSDEDWEKWQKLVADFGDKLLIVGDDLTTTNPLRVHRAIEQSAINAVIIKPNQNGTISGTLEAIRQAREGKLKIIVSHRGEETDDDWIVDFALCVGADYVKFGGMDRGERVAKYNRLLELGMK